MSQTVISAIVAAVGSVVGLLARSTRRARLSGKIDRYSRLAETVETNRPGAGATLRDLVDELTTALIESERHALTRTFDVSNFVLMVAFLSVGGALAFYGWGLHEVWLKVPLLCVAGILAILALVGGGGNLFETIDEAVSPHRNSDRETST